MENFKWFLNWAGDHWFGTMLLFLSSLLVFVIVIEGLAELIRAIRGKSE